MNTRVLRPASRLSDVQQAVYDVVAATGDSSKVVARAAALIRAGPNRPSLSGVVQALAVLAEADCDHDARHSFLSAASSLISAENSGSVSSALFALKGYPPSAEVRSFVMALLPAIPARGFVTPEHVTKVLLGGRPHGELPEGTAVLRAAMPLLLSCSRDAAVRPVVVANLLYSLHSYADAVATQQLLGVLQQVIARCVNPLSAQHLSNALYGMHRQDQCGPAHGVLVVLANLVAKYGIAGPLVSLAVSNSLYGMHLQQNCGAVDGLLEAVARGAAECREDMSPTHLARALYGLGRKKGGAARQLLLCLLPRVPRGATLDSLGVGNALYGMRSAGSSPQRRQMLLALAPLAARCGMLTCSRSVAVALYALSSADPSPEVDVMLGVLAGLVHGCGSLEPVGVGNALYGLLRQSGHTAERVLDALLPVVKAGRDSLSAGPLSCSLFGLQRTDDCASARAMVQAILDRTEPTLALDSDAPGMCMVGMVRLGDSPETRAMYVRLACGIARVTAPLPVPTALALYGLHAQHSTPATQAVLAALVPHVRTCSTAFRERDLCQAIFGMRGMGDTHALQQLMSVLVPCFKQAPHRFSAGFAGMALRAGLSLSEAGVRGAAELVSCAISRVAPDSSNAALMQCLVMLNPGLRPVDLAGATERPCAKEMVIRNVLQRAGVPGLSFNVTHSYFEMDILYRCS